VNILLDCDNVLADFTEYLLQLVGSTQVPADIREYDVFDTLTRIQRLTASMMLETEVFWGTIPPVPGALEAVETMRAANHRVICVTSPWEACRGWGNFRRKWLKREFDIPCKDVRIR